MASKVQIAFGGVHGRWQDLDETAFRWTDDDGVEHVGDIVNVIVATEEELGKPGVKIHSVSFDVDEYDDE